MQMQKYAIALILTYASPDILEFTIIFNFHTEEQ